MRSSWQGGNRGGFSLIEALIAIAMVSIIVVVLGQLIQVIHRTYYSNDLRDRAGGYTQQYMEALTAIVGKPNIGFACKCGTSPCPGNSCSVVSQGVTQTCTSMPGYGSCWVQYPVSDPHAGPYDLDPTGGWHFIPDAADTAIAPFSRSVQVIDLCRDANDAIVACGTHTYQTEKVIVTVSWPEMGVTKSIQQSKIFTGWKSL